MKRLLVLSVAVVALLAGCASSPIDPKTSQALSTSVVAVAEQASAGKLAEAVKKLDALQTQLDKSVEGGTVSEDKAKSIQAAINVVRADLEALIAKAEADKKAEEAAKAAAEAERIAQEKAAAEEAANKPKPGKGKGKKDDDDD